MATILKEALDSFKQLEAIEGIKKATERVLEISTVAPQKNLNDSPHQKNKRNPRHSIQ